MNETEQYKRMKVGLRHTNQCGHMCTKPGVIGVHGRGGSNSRTRRVVSHRRTKRRGYTRTRAGARKCMSRAVTDIRRGWEGVIGVQGGGVTGIRS